MYSTRQDFFLAGAFFGTQNQQNCPIDIEEL